MNDVTHRRLKEGDYESIRALVHELDVEHAAFEPSIFRSPSEPTLSLDEFRKWVRLVDYKLWGAFRGGRLVGFILLRMKDSSANSFVRERRYAHIESFVVAQDCLRQGVGRGLFFLARDYATRQGCEACELAVWEANLGARDFYSALGFRTLQRRLIIDL